MQTRKKKGQRVMDCGRSLGLVWSNKSRNQVKDLQDNVKAESDRQNSPYAVTLKTLKE